MSVEPVNSQATPRVAFIPTAPALEALAQLDRGLGARKPFVLVSGESGAGKSMLVEEAVRRWGARATSRTLAPGQAAAQTLIATLHGLFGGIARRQSDAPAHPERLVETLANATAGGKVAVLVVEDAHQVEAEALLQLQRIAETSGRRQCPFEVVLVGTADLVARLGEPALAPVNEVVSVRVRIDPLSQNDTRHYLLQRPIAEGVAPGMLFSRKACRDIHSATLGLPRAIEDLADEAARRAARAGSPTVSTEHVRSAGQALRARRGATQARVIPSRAERMAAPAGTTRKNGADSASPAAPAEAPPAEPAAEAAPKQAEVSSKSQTAETAPAERKPPASSEIPFSPSTDPRVKDWVSRFGGSGVSIGMGHAQSRFTPANDLGVDEPVTPRPASSRVEGDAAAERVEGGAVAKRGEGGAAAKRSGSGVAAKRGESGVAAKRSESGVAAKRSESGVEAQATPLPRSTPPPPRPPAASSRRRQRGVSWGSWLSAAAVLAFAGFAVVLGQRSGFGTRFDAADTSERPGSDSVQSKAGGLPNVPAPATTPQPAAARTTGDSGRTIDAGPPPQTSELFGVVVGTYLSPEMANAEKDHLERLTTYRVWVNALRVDGVLTYRLMVGRFGSTEDAESAAQALMRRGLIRDANVLPITDPDAR